MELLRYISSVDAMVGVLAVGIVFCIHSPGEHTPYSHWGFLPWLGISLCLSLLTVLIYKTMTLHRFSRQELFLIIIGILTLNSGLALSLRLSPVFINFLAGFLIANFSRSRERVIDVMVGEERTIYILLLTASGAFFSVPTPGLFLLLVVYVTARTAGKLLGGFASVWQFGLGLRKSSLIGLGLYSHGGLSLALALNFLLVAPSDLSRLVLSTVILTIIMSECIAPSLAVRLLRSAGEMQ